MIYSEFIALPAQGEIIAELSTRAPANPFATASFFESKRQVGYETWVLGLRDNAGGFECGCGAFLKRGKLDRTLEIPSLPSVGAHDRFWAGLREFSQQHDVTRLELCTYGSPPGIEIPALGDHSMRRNRCEFVLNLVGNLVNILSSNHKRNVKKAQQSGLVVRRSRSADAASAHQALMSQSMDRRQGRGENVTPIGPSPERIAFLRSGAGELFQVLHAGTVLSSLLVLLAPKGGYYHSAGTSPEGMALGASHFLIHSVARQLSAEGAEVFNLGGADEGSSLARFKGGFGALRVPLPEASFYIGPSWRRLAGRLLTLIRSERETLVRFVIGRISRMIVYAADTATVCPPESQGSVEFRALTPEDLRTLSVGDPSFHARQLERLSRVGASYAYAVFVEGQLAHVSWLLPSVAMTMDEPRVVKARKDEAEITCCETLPAFRGRAIYGIAIRNLFELARGQGVRRIFMKTTPDNKPSQSGIEKAGLERAGYAILIWLPITQRPVVWRRF